MTIQVAASRFWARYRLSDTALRNLARRLKPPYGRISPDVVRHQACLGFPLAQTDPKRKGTPMLDGRLRSFGSVVAALCLCACAGAAPGVMSGNEPTYVESVEVVEHDTSAPEAFADSLRESVLAGAAFYGTT